MKCNSLRFCSMVSNGIWEILKKLRNMEFLSKRSKRCFFRKFCTLKIFGIPDTKSASSWWGSTTGKRFAFVAFTFRKRGEDIFIRVISARYMHKKEREIYEKIKKALFEES